MFRRQTTIGREGLLYVFLAAVVLGAALFKGVNLLLIFAGMLVGPLVLNWIAVGANLRGLRFKRKLPAALSAGDVLTVAIHLTNPRPRLGCWDVVVEEQIERLHNGRHAAPPMRPQVFFPYVRRGQVCKAVYRGRLVNRGEYRCGPLRVSTRFPFGLFARTTTVNDVDTFLVLPRLGRLTRSWAARRREALAGADRRCHAPGPEGDFYGVREWRSGDGQRLIHWRSSARLGNLVVRQFEQPHNRDVALVLDLWQPDRPGAKHYENIELAVSFTATVLADLCRRGGSNAFLAYQQGAPHLAGGAASVALLQGLLEELAVVEAHDRDAVVPLVEYALRHVAAGVEIVLVSTRPVDLNRLTWPTATDAALRERLRRIRCIDASHADLDKYFSVE